MADNVTANAGSGGAVFAADDIASVYYPRSKITIGIDGVTDGDVAATNPLPIGANTAKDGSGTVYAPLVDADGHLQVDALSCVVTNAGTFAVQVNGDALTALQLIDDAIHADDAAFTLGTSKGVMMMGFAGTQSVDANDAAALACDTDGALHIADGGNSITVDNGGTFAVQAAQSGTWNITNVSGTVSLPTGAATAAKQPALGTAGSASSDVITVQGIASMTPLLATVTFASAQAVTQSGTWVLGANSGVDIGDVDVTSVVPGTGATNLGKAIDSASGGTDTGIAALAIRDDSLSALTPIEGDYVPLRVNSTGALHVTGGGGGTQYAVDDVAGATDTGTLALAVRDDALTTLTPADADYTQLRVDSTGALWVRPTSLLSIDEAVYIDDADWTDNASRHLLVGGVYQSSPHTVTDGDVTPFLTDSNGRLAVLATQTGTWNVGTVTTVTTLTGSAVAHDGADSGNPHKIGAKATTSLSGLTLVANADRTDLFAGVDGALITRPHCNLEDIVTGNANNTDGSSTQCIAAQAAGIKTYLTSVVLTNTSASDIYVEIKDGTTTKITLPLPAGGGCVYNPPVPIPGTAATAWNFDASAAATTVYCSMVGFKSKV